MRCMEYYSLCEAPVKIELAFTDIGNITIEPSIHNDWIFIRLDDREIPYRVYESDELHGTCMEFEKNMITRKPMVDVMYTLSNMPADDLTNLVAQLFGHKVPRRDHAYTIRPNLYRIVA